MVILTLYKLCVFSTQDLYTIYYSTQQDATLLLYCDAYMTTIICQISTRRATYVRCSPTRQIQNTISFSKELYRIELWITLIIYFNQLFRNWVLFAHLLILFKVSFEKELKPKYFLFYWFFCWQKSSIICLSMLTVLDVLVILNDRLNEVDYLHLEATVGTCKSGGKPNEA